LRTLVDTSAWVEYLRMTGSATNLRVRDMIETGAPMAITDVVIMELFSGAATSDTRGKIRGLLNRFTMIPIRPLFDYELAAELYVRCRRAGFTPANSNDLLVAAVAIGKKVPLLAADSDFERIAAVSSLRLHAV